MKRIASAVIACSIIGCVGTESDPPGTVGTWVGTITTEGDITTVVNESGSVWGGEATLVEEASIGVEAGPDEFMLGRIRGVAATDDRIFVLDDSAGVVRVYDDGGVHVRDLGGPGQGPGEFNDPRSIAVAEDGTVYVFTGDLRVKVFSPDGEPAGAWETHAEARYGAGRMPTVSRDGTLWLPDYVAESADDIVRREGMRAVGPDGPAGEPLLAPAPRSDDYMLINEFGNARMGRPVPFAPKLNWMLSPTGALVSGFSSEYRIEIRHPDGPVTGVIKSWQPIPITAEQIEWNRRSVTESMRRLNPEWQWNASDIPAHLPAFSDLAVGSDGRIWVRRTVAMHRIDGCDPTTADAETGRRPNCWKGETAYEVFGTDGRFQGTVPAPALALRYPVFRGDHVIGYTEDEAGVGMVKRYRLVLSGEDRQ